MFAPSGILWLALAIFHAVSSVACIEVNGGAAELSWTLRDFEGKPIDTPACTRTNIREVRLNWKAVTDDAAGPLEPDGSDRFTCSDNRGVTEFIIPAGRQMLWIEPICQDAITATSYEVPPPIVRTVVQGTVITLDALLLVVDEDCTCQAASSVCSTAAR